MIFDRLKIATSVLNKDTRYFTLVGEWSSKRESLQVQLTDLPNLVSAYKERPTKPYSLNPKITLAEQIPGIRLRNAIEAATNALYGMSEIAAQFANRVSNGQLPSSFNKLRKRVREQNVDEALIAALGDLQWYERVREARTEWAHYSSAFIGNDDGGEPIVVIQPYRRNSDKQQFIGRVSFRVAEFSQWVEHAISTIDGFGAYLLKHHVLKKLDPDAELTVPQRDENGFPIIHEDNRFAVEKTTIREYLARYAIEF